jgi:hypothetical protein
LALVVTMNAESTEAVASQQVTFVFTSDVHFGITRGNFRGQTNVESRVVNAAMLQKINALPATILPADGGLGAGRAVGPVDFVVITGDIANRQELYPIHIQSATESWAQFAAVYLTGLTLKDGRGRPTPLLPVPGNHDVSNAIGSPSKLVPATDASSMAEMYNLMMKPATPRTKETYRYATDKIYYSRDFGGAHCVFLTMWPDSVARAWIEADLKNVPVSVPVFLFCHDPPEVDARHLTNPRGKHDINATDKFENVVADVYAGDVVGTKKKSEGSTVVEQRALAKFLRSHRNIVGYFHGHSNWTEFYTWKGPDGDLALQVFRADSPMKGKVSGKDETKLAFQVVVFDVAAGKLTARECLWNAAGKAETSASPVAWGASRTVSISTR